MTKKKVPKYKISRSYKENRGNMTEKEKDNLIKELYGAIDELKEDRDLIASAKFHLEKKITQLKAELEKVPKYTSTFKGKEKQITAEEYYNWQIKKAVHKERQAMIAKIEKLISIYLSCRDCYHCPDSCKEEFGEMFKELKKETHFRKKEKVTFKTKYGKVSFPVKGSWKA